MCWSVEVSVRSTRKTERVKVPAVLLWESWLALSHLSVQQIFLCSVIIHCSLAFWYIKGSFNLSKGFSLFCLEIFSFCDKKYALSSPACSILRVQSNPVIPFSVIMDFSYNGSFWDFEITKLTVYCTRSQRLIPSGCLSEMNILWYEPKQYIGCITVFLVLFLWKWETVRIILTNHCHIQIRAQKMSRMLRKHYRNMNMSFYRARLPSVTGIKAI